MQYRMQSLFTVDANISSTEALTLTSSNATWQDAQDDGVFLGLSAWGDFIVEMTVSSMDATVRPQRWPDGSGAH